MANDDPDYPYPILIDNGSGSIKAGFCGDDEPRIVFANAIYRLRSSTSSAEVAEDDTYIGDASSAKREILSVRYPIERGIVIRWDDMEKIWHHIFHNELRSSPEQRPIFITEAALNPKGNREKMTQILFEQFRTPALHLSNDAPLVLYASGRNTGIVLNCGDGVTSVMPVYDGHIVPDAIRRVDLAGRDVTDYFIQLLAERGYAFTTTMEREIVRDIKDKLGYVAMDYEQELQVSSSSRHTETTYKLPDGHEIKIGHELFQCAEALFVPRKFGYDESGVIDLLQSALRKCDVDIHRDLYSNIILAGGTTLFSGFADRVNKDLLVSTPPSIEVDVVAAPERRWSTWIGGSIIGSLALHQSMWIARQEYDECGPSVVHRKFA